MHNFDLNVEIEKQTINSNLLLILENVALWCTVFVPYGSALVPPNKSSCKLNYLLLSSTVYGRFADISFKFYKRLPAKY